MSNTPFRNIKLKAKNFGAKNPEMINLTESESNFEERWETLEAAGHHTFKYQIKNRGINSVKHNADVQKVREAILGSIDATNSQKSQNFSYFTRKMANSNFDQFNVDHSSEYGAHERRKMRFLNSIDEDKDQYLFKQKVLFGEVKSL